MVFSKHPREKCAHYVVDPESLLNALSLGQTFLDLNRGGTRARVITVYSTDQRTVEARRAGGRWVFLSH
jgi:hypothetical protein